MLSVLYNAVDGLDNAKSIQDLLHETAKDVRTNDYFAVNGKFGTGLEAKLMLLGVGAQVGFKQYYEDVYTSTPKLTIEAAVGIHLSNEVFLGAEGKASKNAETDVQYQIVELHF